MNLRNKIVTSLLEILEYLLLIFNMSTLIILLVKFEEFSNAILSSSYQLLSENSNIILIFIVTLLCVSSVLLFFKKTKILSLFIIFLFEFSYSAYLYYNLYVLYNTCSCQSLFSFISLKENLQVSLLVVMICIIYLILLINDRIKSNRQTL